MNKNRIAEIKRTLSEGRAKFGKLINALPVGHIDTGAALLLNDWQAFIDNDVALGDLASVDGFQSICGIGSKLSKKQTYEELMLTAASCFAEIDLAVHLIRERRNSTVRKLREVPGSRQADFEVIVDPVLYVESKYILAPTSLKLDGVMTSAVDQIVDTASSHNVTKYHGVVWVFSYQHPAGLNNQEVQQLVMGIQEKLRTKVSGNLKITFQVYRQGLYGDCTL